MQSLEELLAKADSGDIQACYEYADELRETIEGDESPAFKEVVKYLSIAAKSSLVPACNDLGHLYRLGIGVPMNYEEALRLFMLGAESGNSESMHEVAMFYYSGWGVKEDIMEATKWLKRSAELGYLSSSLYLGADPFNQYVDSVEI